MPSSGYTAITFVANEQPTTAKWNLIGSNDASFNNGNGFEDAIILSRHLAAGIVRPDNLGLGAQSANIPTAETTTSSSYVDLATVGPSVTVNIGANGMALVVFSSAISNSTTANTPAVVAFSMTGANAYVPSGAGGDPYALRVILGATTTTSRQGHALLLTGLNPGSTTFRLKYQTAGGTALFSDRRLAVIPI